MTKVANLLGGQNWINLTVVSETRAAKREDENELE